MIQVVFIEQVKKEEFGFLLVDSSVLDKKLGENRLSIEDQIAHMMLQEFHFFTELVALVQKARIKF